MPGSGTRHKHKLVVSTPSWLAMMLLVACSGSPAPASSTTPTALPPSPAPATSIASPMSQPTSTVSALPTLETTPPPIIETVRADLAGRLSRPISDVETRVVEPRQWSDQCLEIPQAAFDCLPIPVQGYKVILAVDNAEFEYHTDADHQMAIVQTPSLAQVSTIWLEVRRESEKDGFCDVWRVQEGDSAGGVWEAPCHAQGPYWFYTQRFYALREVILTTASFTEQIDDPYPMTAHVYGLGAQAPSDYARVVVRDFMRWLPNPAGEGSPGRCTYVDSSNAFSIEYPCNWEVEIHGLDPESGIPAIALYSPWRGASYPYAPSTSSKVTIQTTSPYPKGSGQPITLDEMERQWVGDLTVVERQEITLYGQPALRIVTEDESGRGLFYLLVADGLGYALVGLGDLTNAEAVMSTFQVR